MESTNKNLPAWALALLILVFLIALGFTFWGFVSAINLNKKDKQSEMQKIFKNKKIFSCEENFEINEGVFALVFLNYKKDDYFLPIYIFSTKNFIDDRKKILEKIENNNFEEISNYMKEKKIKIASISFIQLEIKNSLELKDNWIIKTNSGKRGFNK